MPQIQVKYMLEKNISPKKIRFLSKLRKSELIKGSGVKMTMLIEQKMVMRMKNVAQDGVGNERKHFRPQMRHRRSHPQNKNGPLLQYPQFKEEGSLFYGI